MAFDQVVAFLRANLEPETFQLLRPGEIALRAAQFVTHPGDVTEMTRHDDLLAMSPADRQLLFRRLIGRAAVQPVESVRREMLAQIREATMTTSDRLDLDTVVAEMGNGELPAASRRLIDTFLARAPSAQVPSVEAIRSRKGTGEGVGEVAFLAYWLHCHGHPDLPALLALSPERRWQFIEDFALDTDRYPHEVEERLGRFAAAVER